MQIMSQMGNAARMIRTEIIYRVYKPRRVLFDHLPKCAGTTVTHYLIKHYPKRVIFRMDGRHPRESVRQFQSFSERSRYRYCLIVGHHTHELIDYVHPDTIKFTIFRDPVDRIISHYFYVKRDKRSYLHDRVTKGNIRLEEYATSGISSELRNWYTTHFTGLTVKEAEMNPEESVLMASNIIRDRYCFFGFQEDLKVIMNKLRQTARLPVPYKNRPLNKTSNRPEFEEIHENVKNVIAEVNFLDVELYSMLKTEYGQINHSAE